jgi:hypothetical protein
MEIINITRIYIADLVAVVLLAAGEERCLRNLLHCNGLLKNSAVVMPDDTAAIITTCTIIRIIDVSGSPGIYALV